MNILHINSYYSSSIFYKNLFDQQVNNKVDINVFVPVSSSLKSFENNLGSFTNISRNHNKYDRLFFHLKQFKIYEDIINKYDIAQYSLIHAHSLFTNGYVALKLKQQYGVPYIVAIRNTDVNIFFKRMLHLRKVGIEIIKNADKIIFLSSSYKDFVIDNYIPNDIKMKVLNNTIVIPNGIDKFWLSHLSHNKSLQDKKKLKLLQVGRLDKNKNIITTVKAVEILLNRGFEINLTIVGEIKQLSIYNQIKELDYVIYKEPIKKEELIKIYRQNDIFIMPSIHETFGLVYVEAMSQGLPVIYTRGQGFDGFFKDGEVGFAVEPSSAVDIADKLEKLIESYEEISQNCLAKCEEFNWISIEKIYREMYLSVIKE